jgi:hypothetical protein
MYAINFPFMYGGESTHAETTQYPDMFDNAPRDVDELCRFAEGVEWLLASWQEVLPHLPEDDGPPDPKLTGTYDPPADPELRVPVDPPQAFLERKRKTALRLLGVPTGTVPPPQPLREAAEAEVRRLEKLYSELSANPTARLDSDLALFDESLTSQLLQRYEAGAQRELLRSLEMLMKLRKDPELFPLAEAEANVVEEKPCEAEPPSEPGPASAPSEPSGPEPPRQRVRRRRPSPRNEANCLEMFRPGYNPVEATRAIGTPPDRRS